jgi:biotin carboxylase
MAFRLAVDHISQPSRATMVLARALGLDYVEDVVRIASGATRADAYRGTWALCRLRSQPVWDEVRKGRADGARGVNAGRRKLGA